MSQQRKRVEKVQIIKPSPKKREQPIEAIPEVKVIGKIIPKVEVKKKENVLKPEIKEEDLINPEIAEYKRAKAKPSNDKYVKYASSEYLKNKNIISEKIQKNEIKFAYFAIDGDDFYHYYILIK